MSTKQTQKTKRCCSAVLVGVLLAALSAGCSNPAGGNKPSGGNMGGGGTPGGGGSGTPPAAPFVEGGASLILSPDKLNIKVTVTTADNYSPVTVEGCTETMLTDGTETTLHAKGTLVILKGKITELNCRNNQLTALNVRGCTALKGLNCWGNRLAALNVQDLTALQGLNCEYNQLTALNVQGLNALRWLQCDLNKLTELNVQGCTALQLLQCNHNQLTALNVQGLTALRGLNCNGNRLTVLNMQGLTALQRLSCYGNKLTALDVQGLTALQELECFKNQLAELNVQGCTALKTLKCNHNQLTADAFKTLFDNLPVRAEGDRAECYLYTERTGEGNHTNFSALPDLAAAFTDAKNNKKWKMYKFNASGLAVEI